MRQYGLSLCAATLVSTPYLGPHLGQTRNKEKWILQRVLHCVMWYHYGL